MKYLKTYNESKKPSPKKVQKLDYHDMMDYLEKKYNFQSRGFSGIPSTMDVDRHFDNWCDKHNLPQKDKDGKYRNSSQIFYKQYQAAPDGEKEKPPYMDFWHYLVDINEPHNGSYIYIPREVEEDEINDPQYVLNMYKDLKKQYKNDPEMCKNCDIIIKRQEEEIKNPKPDPWKGWKQQITDLIFKEFGEFADGDSLEVWVEW